MDITIIAKRASDVVNGFTIVRTSNAKDTLDVISVLEQTLAANRRLNNALIKATEELNKANTELELLRNKNSEVDLSGIDFSDLFKGIKGVETKRY